MGYALSTLDIADVVRSVWESGLAFNIENLQVRGDATPVFWANVDFTNINVIWYYFNCVHQGNNYDISLILDSTTEFTDTIGGNGDKYGRIDTSGYTGSTDVKVTLDGTNNSGYLTTGSKLMAVGT